MEEIDIKANKKALGSSKTFFRSKGHSIAVNIVSQNVRHLDTDESRASLKVETIKSPLDALPVSDYNVICL